MKAEKKLFYWRKEKRKIVIKQPYAGLQAYFCKRLRGLRQVPIFLRSFELQTHTELPFHPANGNIYYSFTAWFTQDIFPQREGAAYIFLSFFGSEEYFNSSP
jgi:hypothetical protein